MRDKNWKVKQGKKYSLKPFLGKSRGNSGQMIVLMGFFLILGIITLSIISANLSSIGTDVSKIHSKGLLPEFINVKSKFALAHGAYFNTSNGDMLLSFEQATQDIYRMEIRYGNYFNATLNNYGYSGRTMYGAVYHISATLQLSDGVINISKDASYIVSKFDYNLH